MSSQVVQSFAWVEGENPNFRHIRLIDAGAFGEVYEMCDLALKRNFARKVLKIQLIRQEDLDTEIRACERLGFKDKHQNIVHVLRSGFFNSHSSYFIDMELCNLSLDEYIRKSESRHVLLADNKKGTTDYGKFVSKDAPIHIQAQNIWAIMGDIANGLVAIHDKKLVHRDLKPKNNNAWKVADFGMFTEGSSNRMLKSESGRGTASYRAPELLEEGLYSKKVDIWAMGCILYEVACARKAFDGDWRVYQYSLTKSLPQISLTISSDPLVVAVTLVLQKLLDPNPTQRPRSLESRNEFALAGRIFGPQNRMLELSSLIFSSTERHIKYGNLDAAIAAATELVYFVPVSQEYRKLLANLYISKGDADIAIAGWKGLIKRCRSADLRIMLEEACVWRIDEGEGPITTWEPMLDLIPTHPRLQIRIISACESEGDIDNAITAWYDLVDRNCHISWLQDQLARAYAWKGADASFTGWRELMVNHPNERTLRERLKQEWETRNYPQGTVFWEELARTLPDDFHPWIRDNIIEATRKQQKDWSVELFWNYINRRYPVATASQRHGLKHRLDKVLEAMVDENPMIIVLAVLFLYDSDISLGTIDLNVRVIYDRKDGESSMRKFLDKQLPGSLIWLHPRLLSKQRVRKEDASGSPIDDWLQSLRRYPNVQRFQQILAEYYQWNESFEKALELRNKISSKCPTIRFTIVEDSPTTSDFGTMRLEGGGVSDGKSSKITAVSFLGQLVEHDTI